jgi:hypothetical protein
VDFGTRGRADLLLHVVTRQGLRAGSKHPANTAVTVTLSPVKLGR